MESPRKPKASPEEIKSALHATDIVAREKAERNRKEQARTAKPHEIGEEEIEGAEKISGQKFQRLN